MTSLAVYCGNPPSVGEFEAWLGRNVDLAMFFPGAPTNQIPQWQGDRRNLVVCPAMLEWGQGTLKQGADGVFNGGFVSLAQHLVAIGQANAVIRLGWEFNANWMPWRAAADPISFKKYWRNIVRAMRTTPGQAFKFDWCVWINRAELPDPTVVYPGDEFVDYIGVDVYDSAGTLADWKHKANGNQGLEYWAEFAAKHGKKMSIPEWGLCPSGGDDVLFVEKVEKWVRTHDVAYHSYFNTDATGYGIGDHRLSLNAVFPAPPLYPQAAARYRQLFGV